MADPTTADVRQTPRDADLGLRTLANESGLALSVLPNGCLFAIEDRRESGTGMINPVLGPAAAHGAGGGPAHQPRVRGAVRPLRLGRRERARPPRSGVVAASDGEALA